MTNQEAPVLPVSIEGEYTRRAEARRQLLLEGFVPAQTVDFLAASHYQDLNDEQKKEVDHRLREEIRLGIDKPRKFNALDLEVQGRTGRAIYVDDQGNFLNGYVPQRVLAEYVPSPRWYNLQTYINAADMVELPVVGHFGEAPILGLPELREVLETRELMQLLDRVEKAGEGYPSPEAMGIVSAHEVICEDRVIRSKTTTEFVGYDDFYADSTLQTVEKHNDSANSLIAVTMSEALKALDEGKVVLWNAGGSVKHYISEIGTQEAV